MRRGGSSSRSPARWPTRAARSGSPCTSPSRCGAPSAPAGSDKERTLALAKALTCLDPRMKRVVERRFGLDGQAPQTLEELGGELGITRERVRQLELRALRQLREAAPGLLDYLR